MDLQAAASRGIVLLGCGKMGSALLQGWLAGGLDAGGVWVREPRPSDWLSGHGRLHLNDDLPHQPALVLVAVKPQMITETLPDLAAMGGGPTTFLSIAAGTTLARLSEILGSETPIIRAMPNTPAAIGHGITALAGNAAARPHHLDLAEALMRAGGQVVRLDREDQIDAVTGVSGSGPAYVFHLIEALTAAAIAEGLPEALSSRLARATVTGAARLAEDATQPPDVLRRNVTSPGGTTEAGLAVLMDETAGLSPLMRRTVAAAVARSRELAR